MPYYAQITDGRVSAVTQTGEVDSPNMIEIEEFDASLLGKLYSGGVFSDAPAVPVRRLTKLQFIGRLTPTEAKGLLSAADSDPDVRLFVRMLDWATPEADGTSVDLDDPRTVAAIQALFSSERAAEILA